MSRKNNDQTGKFHEFVDQKLTKVKNASSLHPKLIRGLYNEIKRKRKRTIRQRKERIRELEKEWKSREEENQKQFEKSF